MRRRRPRSGPLCHLDPAADKSGTQAADGNPDRGYTDLGSAHPSTTPSCHDSALFVEDVTYPDDTRLTAGEKFAKTWKFQNTGSCKWTGYTIAFVSGDRLDAPRISPGAGD